MTEPVSIVLVGIGGYGNSVLSALLDPPEGYDFRIVGAVDPAPERCRYLDRLKEMGVPVMASLEEFYASGRADLAIIASPIHFHCRQTCLALEHGSNVLCEKPVAATVQEVRRMIEARDRAGRFVAVGYQWSFGDAIQGVKRDIQKGLFGAPIRLRSMMLLPRSEKYYRRNNWAGRQKDGEGNWILDSPANNALAHELHAMFYVLGDRVDTSARPVDIVGEVYRANDIENFDTAALRCHTDVGAEVLFYCSHASLQSVGPLITYEFERGSVWYETRSGQMRGSFPDGGGKFYGFLGNELSRKFWDAIDAARGGGRPVCGLEAALSQTLCINGLCDSMPDVVDFPAEYLRVAGEQGARLTWVSGLFDVMAECFERGLLPSEVSAPWGRKGRVVDLTDYRSFPGGKS